MVEPPQWHSTFPLSSLIQLSFWVILIGIVSAGANQAEIRERQKNGLDVRSDSLAQSCTHLDPLSL